MREHSAGLRTIPQWERHLGEQVRALRLRADLTQAQLAHLADVSVTTVHNLETGNGTSLATLVKVVRALGHTDWLEQLAPPIPVSPLQLLRERERTVRPRQRASGRGAT